MQQQPDQRARWTPLAVQDVREIWLYYSRVASNEVANNAVRRIQQAGDRTAGHPMMFRSREEIGKGLRSVRVSPYFVFYRLVEEGTEILRILHEKRDLTDELGTHSDQGAAAR